MSADDEGDGHDGSSMESETLIFTQDLDDDASWPSICSHHGSRYPRQERFIERNEQGDIVLGYTKSTLNAQDIPWVMAWLQGDPEGMVVGMSLSLQNGGIFPINDIPEGFRAKLEREQTIHFQMQWDWERSFDVNAVLNQSPTGPLYNLMLIMRQRWLWSGDGTRLFGHVFDPDDYSSYEDHPLSGDP